MICYLNLLPSSKTGTAPPAGSVLSPAVAALGLLSPAVAALVGCCGAVSWLLTPAVAASRTAALAARAVPRPAALQKEAAAVPPVAAAATPTLPTARVLRTLGRRHQRRRGPAGPATPTLPRTVPRPAVPPSSGAAAPSAGCRLSPPFRLGMNQRCVFVFPLAY